MRYAWFRDGGLVVDQGFSTAGYGTGGADLGHNVQLQVTYEYTTSGVYHGWSARSGNVAVSDNAPNQPDAQSPGDGATSIYVPGGSSVNPSFTARFSDPDGDSGYLNWDIQLWNGSSYQEWQSSIGSGIVNNTAWGTFFPNSRMSSGSYAWDVTPQDQWGAYGSTLGWFSLQVYETPTAPTLSSPTDSQTVPNPTPTLVASATDAEHDQIYYRFQVATDANFSTGGGGSLVGDFAWLTNGSCGIPTSWADPNDSSKTQSLKPGRAYFWRVQAADRDGQGIWSSARSFTVRALPHFGASGNWPMWSNGRMAINETNGNLVLSLPTPSFPTSVGSLSLAITYNSQDPTASSLGTGWSVGQTGTTRLVDHSITDGSDEVERFYPDGSSVFYQRVLQSTMYLPTDGSNAQLTRNPDRTFTLIDDDGSVATFGAANSSTGVALATSLQTLSANAGVGEIDYSYDGQQRLQAVTAKSGATTIATLGLTWGCSAALVCISGPDGVVWKYVSDGSGRLQSVNDGTRDVVKIIYDGNGRPEHLYNADDLDPAHASPGYNAAHDLLVSYDSSNRVSSVAQEHLSSQTPSTSTWSFGYHPDPSGSTRTDATASGHGQLTAGSQRLALGYTTITPPCEQAAGTCAGHSGSSSSSVYYDDNGQTLENIDLLGHRTQVQYTPAGQLQWTEDQDGKPTDYSYDSVDQTLLSVTAPDPDGAGPLARPVTNYNYDETVYGSVSGSTYTPGSSLHGVQSYYFRSPTLISSTGSGRADAISNDIGTGTFDFAWGSSGPPQLAGVTTNYSARFVGDITIGSTGDPSRAFQFQTYADAGTTLTVDGQSLINNWGAAAGVTTQTSPSITLAPGKHRFALEYQETATSSPNSILSLRYKCVDATNCVGQPTVMSSIGATALLPAWGNRTSTVSAAGRVSFSHFAQPWTTQPDYSLVQAPINGAITPLVTSFRYDTHGRTTGKVLPNGNLTATLNSNGDLAGGGDPATSNYGTTYTYYADTATADTPDTSSLSAACPGASNAAQLGLVLTVQRHGVHAVTTIYDHAGRPVSVANNAGTQLNCYSSDGLLIATRAGGDSNPTRFSYDPSGLALSQSHSGSVDSTAGSVTSTYDEAGRLTDTIDANGAEENLAYDANGNVISRVAAKGSLASSTTYTTTYVYNDADQLTRETDPAQRSYSFFYDSRGSLRGTQYPNGTFSWTDRNSNGWRLDQFNRRGTITSSTSAAPNETTPLGDYTYSYDQDGLKTGETVATVHPAVAAGNSHSVALRSDGTVWSSGSNSNGQFGNRTTLDSATFVQTPELTSVTAIAAGAYHTMALKTDGTVWAWGQGTYGQLGNGSTLTSTVPVQVSGLTGATAISADENGYHSLALKSDGTVWAWGYGGDGRLGTGTTTSSSTPVQVVGLSGAVAIAAGGSHSLAVKSDGTVWAWGYNANGQLGNGTTTSSSTPVQVNGLTGVTVIEAGDSHSLAIKSDGSVWAWGYNGAGQLGNGTTTNALNPVQVSGLTGVSAVSGGQNDSLAVKADGTVWAWGANGSGQLGTGATGASALTPVQSSNLSGVTAIAAGFNQMLALGADGSVWSWGQGASGELGNGARARNPDPIRAAGVAGTKIAAGASHTAAIATDGTVWEWGHNDSGQLGNGSTSDSATPVRAGSLNNVTAIAAGSKNTLAIKSDSTAWGWGYNGYGQLCNGTTTNSSTPVQLGSLTGVTAVASGNGFTLVLKSDGTVWGCGLNLYGQLGNGTTTRASTPVQVSGLSGVTAIAAGANGYHSLALKADGTVWAWGYNYYGQLGNGVRFDAWTPVQVTGLIGVVAIAAGANHSLAVKSDGTVWTWGYNAYGQLGNNSTTNSLTPLQVPGLSGATKAAGGDSDTLALKSDGTVWAWGYNGDGDLGNGVTVDSHTPTQVNGIATASGISAGADHGVAIKSDNTIWGWGDNTYGELGNGALTIVPAPAPTLFQSSAKTSFEYDSLGRLQSSMRPDGTSQRYCYDADSNRTRIISGASDGCAGGTATSTYGYSTGSNIPIDAVTDETGPQRSFTYDGGGTAPGDGAMTGRGSDSFSYDGLGRLRTATIGGNSVCYTYSPDGSLLRRDYQSGAPNCATPSGSTRYSLGDLFETDATGVLTASHTDGPAGDLASFNGAPTTSSAVAYLYYNGHGDLAVEADASGGAINVHTYSAFGSPLDAVPSNTTSHRFVGRWGKEYDSTSNVVLMGARPYDPSLGRFLSVDPVDGGSFNNYDYASQDPIGNYDLNGLRPLVESPFDFALWHPDPGSSTALVIVGGARGSERTTANNMIVRDAKQLLTFASSPTLASRATTPVLMFDILRPGSSGGKWSWSKCADGAAKATFGGIGGLYAAGATAGRIAEASNPLGWLTAGFGVGFGCVLEQP